MNKAFTREPDASEAVDESLPYVGESLPGGKNYMTPTGARRLQEELRTLRYKERPEVTRIVSWAAANGDRSENGDYHYNKRRLREIDKRIRFLSMRLQSAEVVDPAAINSDQVLFGATVTVRDEEDHEKTYFIVGVDEVDAARGRISWVSPLGVALLKARVGDIVTVHSPQGPREIEIVGLKYQEIA